MDHIKVSPEAEELSKKCGKLPQTCQLILDESKKVFFSPHKTVLAIHNQGYKLTSGGVDKYTKNSFILIPRNSDKSAKLIREKIEELTNTKVSVLIADSDGRDDRNDRKCSISVALGLSGFNPIYKTAQVDPVSGKTKYSEEYVSAMLACGASLLLGQRGKGTLVITVRGLTFEREMEKTIVGDVIHYYKTYIAE